MESLLGAVFDWIGDHQRFALWLGFASIAVFIVSLLSMPWLVSQIPEDYFARDDRRPTPWKTLHPAFRLTILILKNLFGLTLLLGGILMLILPGQGLLTIMMGLLLMDYPGKFRLERWLVSRPTIEKLINWMRDKRGRKPLQIPQD
ncbi:MAG: PGPGW domain-containing protein [bacterium]